MSNPQQLEQLIKNDEELATAVMNEDVSRVS